MDLYEKISVLGPSAKFDTCGPRDFGDTTNVPGVYHAKVGGNRICRLFKVLQTNVCKNNCTYCAFRNSRSCTRTSTTPDEMARAFDIVHKKRLVDGLFLSSGIVRDPSFTMTNMLDTVHILRERYEYKGYVHLKIMPETPTDCIQEALKCANRISLNIESPTEADLHTLSPDKALKKGFFHTLLRIRSELNKLKAKKKRGIPSLTTQFIVGAGREKDYDIIRITNVLYQQFGLTRVFFSAFRPVQDTPLAEKPAESITRAHRLYQADFLMRFYKFTPSDLPLDSQGFLYADSDPKLIWAQNHPEVFPININKAGYWDLLKIPGIGPTNAKKIMKLRKEKHLSDLNKLAGNRISLKKVSSYVCF